ncbi:Pectinesterase, catalytic [Dillenia turbinata]|uniref:Pectinesterase, catalytic n=1 Tax=Dillenia turbinata TaxID=194707 RepID=A0AAN8UFF9_9MAGN
MMKLGELNHILGLEVEYSSEGLLLGFIDACVVDVAMVGEGFLARDITFQNTTVATNHHAIALHFFLKYLIMGTVDFILGNAAAMFQDCDINARKPGLG